MNDYTFQFQGRQNGAIGATEFIIASAKGDNAKDALLRLYERFEHIHVIKVTNQDGENIPLSEVR